MDYDITMNENDIATICVTSDQRSAVSCMLHEHVSTH